MLVEDFLYGIGIERSFCPEPVGFALYLLGIEFCQAVLEVCHHLLAVAVLKHFEQVKLYGIDGGLCCHHKCLLYCFRGKDKEIFDMFQMFSRKSAENEGKMGE